MVQYRVDIDGTTFDELDNVKGESTINPFGDRFVVTFRDFEGDKFDSISINSTAEIYAREPTPPNQSNNTFDKIFEGYIVQADTRTEGGADILDITIYSFDQLIRNETVSNDQTDEQIDAILKDIIQTDTPVEYLSGNVAVQDNRKIRRSLQGVKVEEALRFLSRRSENEEYGVNPTKEFFFRPREETSANVDITDNDAIDYNIPSRGKEQKTEVTCFYDGGDKDITVTLGSEQLQAQEDFGTQDAVPFPDEINRPSVTNRQEALEIARNFARDREQTLAGQVIAVGSKSLVDADVGDSINVTLSTRGLDDEFTIVTKEVDYIRNEVALGIVEKRGDQDSLLKAIGQQVKRNELEGADQSKPADVVEQTAVRADITPSFDSLNVDSIKLTTTGRNKLRDAWDDGSQPDIQTAVLGSGDSTSRADTSVSNQVNTSSTTVGTTSTSSVDFGFSLTGTGNIIGFEDSDNDLIVIALLSDSETDPGDTLNISIADNSQGKSVLTETGQNLIRDLFDPTTTANLSAQVEFGDGGTDPTQTDSSLDNTVDITSLTNNTILDASTTTELSNAVDNNDELLDISGGSISLNQTAFVTEGEDVGGDTVSDVDYSNGEGGAIGGSGSPDLNFTFTTEYEIPNSRAAIYFRGQDGSTSGQPATVDVFFDGTQIESDQILTFDTLKWREIDLSPNVSNDIQPGTHTIKIQYGGTPFDNVNQVFDVLAFVDTLYTKNLSSLDNTVHQNSGYLDNPQRFSGPVSANIEQITPRQSVKSATLSVNINNTNNSQQITIGNGTTKTGSNTASVTEIFDPPTETISGSLTLDAFGTNGSQTPRENFRRQSISNITINTDLSFLNPTEVGRADIEAFLTISEADGTTYQEVGQSDGSNLLTRSIYPEFTSDSQAVILSEDLGIDIS